MQYLKWSINDHFSLWEQTKFFLFIKIIKEGEEKLFPSNISTPYYIKKC